MNKRSLLQKIKRDFPKLHWLKSRHIIEGWDHYVLQLDNKYIFRFPRKKHYAKQLYAETKFLNYLKKKKLGVTIPQYAFVAKNKSFAGYKMIAGVQMTRPIFDKLNTTVQNNGARQLAHFISVLHSIPRSVVKTHRIPKKNIKKQYQELVNGIEKYLRVRLSKKQIILIEAYLAEFAQYQKFPTTCFTHSDLHPWHIILNKQNKKINGIIDFSDRCLNDPAIDFGELWAYGKNFVETVYKYYKGPKDKNFLIRSKLYYKRIPLWIMISSLVGNGGSFTMGYNMFKKVFT